MVERGALCELGGEARRAGGGERREERTPPRLPLFDEFNVAPTHVSVSASCVSNCKRQFRRLFWIRPPKPPVTPTALRSEQRGG